MTSTKEKSTPEKGAGNAGMWVGRWGDRRDFKCPEDFNEKIMPEEKPEGGEGVSPVRVIQAAGRAGAKALEQERA